MTYDWRRLLARVAVVAVLIAIATALAYADFDAAAAVILLLLIITIYWTVREELKAGSKQVVWHDTRQSSPSSHPVTMTIAGVSVEELLDPVTGVGFNSGEEIWQCANCSSLYHPESHEFISEQNSNRCVVCKSQGQISRYRPGKVTRPVKYEVVCRFRPETIALNDVARNEGRIVSFEGRVVEVQRSQTSETYAVKFQRGRWTGVFKLVIFPQYVGSFAQGATTIKSYRGHTIRVRGLIQRHDTFGYQIIVNSEDMIEVVD